MTNCNIVLILEENAAAFGVRTAIVDEEGRSLSFFDLNERVKQQSAALLAEGLKREQIVLLAIAPGIDFFVALLAILRVGARVLLIEPGSVRRVLSCLEAVRPDFVLTVPWLVPLFACRYRTLTLSHRKSAQAPAAAFVERNGGALITFTSGTTGSVKAIERSHGFLVQQAEVIDKSLALSASHTTLTTLPVFTLAHLFYGVTTILVGKKSCRKALKLVARHQPKKILCAPAFLTGLLEARAGQDLSCLKEVLVGGAPIFPSLVEAVLTGLPQATVTSVYGASEAEPICHFSVSSKNSSGYRRLLAGAARGQGLYLGKCEDSSVNMLILAEGDLERLLTQATVTADDLARLSASEGHLLVAGEHVNQGYFHEQRSSNKLKVLQNDGSTRVYHATGDMVKICGDELFLTGRAGYESSCKKGRYPLMVEAFAKTHDCIGQAAYVELDGPSFLAVLAVTLKGREANLEPELEAYCKKEFIKLVVMKKLPLDARHGSKVLYEKLKKELRAFGYSRPRGTWAVTTEEPSCLSKASI
ncbi:MAG: AMP-binding protein [Candidatus Melainabacteria bacterium]|nr:AMP-binding protein [Candidatus Melainabacteria bacterium]